MSGAADRSGSQVEVTPKLPAVAAGITEVHTGRDLSVLRDQLLDLLSLGPYDQSSRAHEQSIRWGRTARQILSEGYVYGSRGCTDLLVTFIRLCCAKGLQTRFVKVRNRLGKTHSLAQVRVAGEWWIVECVARGREPVQGEVTKGTPYRVWELSRKGADAWSVGLNKASDITKIH
jgi:hypothetical protein